MKLLVFENLPLLPEDAELLRASGLVRCAICGQLYYDHPRYAYPSLMGVVHKACYNDFGKEVYLHL